MSVLIDDGSGNLVPVFVRETGGMIEAVVRAATREAWVAAALQAGLLIQDDPDDPGTIRPGRGVNISEIGPMELEPAVLDSEGNVTTAAAMDERWHVNVRLSGYALEDVDEETGRLRWHLMALAWTYDGVPDPVRNANEEARVLMDVALIDPDTIASPSRVFQ